MFALFVVLHSSGDVGGILLTLRCVQRQDKAMALGITSLAIALFGKLGTLIIWITRTGYQILGTPMSWISKSWLSDINHNNDTHQLDYYELVIRN